MIWSENDLLLAIGAYKKGDYSLNECNRLQGVLIVNFKRPTDQMNSVCNKVKSLGRPPIFTANNNYNICGNFNFKLLLQLFIKKKLF